MTTTGRTTDPTTVATELVSHLERTWNRADATAFGEAFAHDSDFVNIHGAHYCGRAAITAGHHDIFNSIYLGSTVRYELDRARQVAPECIVAIVLATLEAPHGPLQGTNHARFTLTITGHHEGWLISAFHNTLCPPAS